MASVTKMAAAAKLAEERIRLDIGGNMTSVEDDEVIPATVTDLLNHYQLVYR